MEIRNPQNFSHTVSAGSVERLVVRHTEPTASSLDVQLEAGASLTLVEVFEAEAFCECRIRQQAASRCAVTSLQLTSANVSYTIDLDGAEAENTLGAAFLATGEEHCAIVLRTNHNVPDCRSNSYVKGVAGGCALGEFRGLVYVAPDAQRTDARQQSRNILLGDTARIEAKPQLEIYADDVKCSHGATVGQMDSEAILYMRQRGLSETQARQLQIEGFVGDVVMHCGVEGLCEQLMEQVKTKMEKM